MIKQKPKPITVGIKIATITHLHFPVSFLMVKQVVEQGQCIKIKITTQTAVKRVQPLATNKSFKTVKSVISVIVPSDIYPMTIIGMTISLAGNPKIKAINITPSKPNKDAKGFKKSAHIFKILTFPIWIFAIHQIIRPAGAATKMALPKTNKVLSKMERTITFPIWGLRYGGSSNVKEDGVPFKMVLDKIFDVNSVIITLPTIRNANKILLPIVDPVLTPTKKMVMTLISAGNLPLHGTKEFVKIAINLSLGESIIRQPVTPAALHPKPIHILRACFPQA